MELDQAIQELSIKDDGPLILSNQAQYCSIERNKCSIVGRFLNPSLQRMSNWILDMPRIWRLYSRVRGVALSQERFQFFFNSEDDLIEILKTGIWTQDEWCVVMERWVEKPTEDSLMFVPVWLRLRNIPINYYTEDTIKKIAGCVGQVLKVELDLEKSQAQDYVRVQVLFDVRNPLRNSKEVQTPSGEVVSVSFDFERIRKRCFYCQRLTHEKNVCPQSKSEINKETAVHPRSCDSGLIEGKAVLRKNTEKNLYPDKLSTLTKASCMVHSENIQSSFKKVCIPNLSISSAGNGDYEMISELPLGVTDASSSGLSIKQKNPRKRKASLIRKKQELKGDTKGKEDSLNIEFASIIKRKKESTGVETSEEIEKDEFAVVHHEPLQYD